MNKPVPFRNDPLNWVALAVVIFGLALSVGFFVIRANTPSDGARMIITDPVWQEESVIVTRWEPEPDGTYTRYAIFAVDGVRMEDLTQAAVTGQPNDVAKNYRVGETVVYYGRRAQRDDTVADIRTRPMRPLPTKLTPFPWDKWFAENWLIIAVTLACIFIAGVVFFRRPSDRTTRAMVLWVPGLMASQIMYSLGLQIGDFVRPLNLWWFMLTASAGYILTLIAILRFAFEFTRPPERVAAMLRNSRAIIASYVVPYAFFIGFLIWQWLVDPNVLRWFGKWRIATALIAAACIGLSLIVAAWSYFKTKDYVTRQKVRWIVYVGGAVGSLNILLITLPALIIRRPLANLTIASILFFVFELAIAYAIFRYRYLDVDVFINRTLVVGVMSVLLALFYFTALVVVQVLFDQVLFDRLAISSESRTDIVIVLTTLIGIALFNPVRSAVQQLVDRLFFPHKYEAARRIAAFTTALRDDAYADMNRLMSDLLTVTKDVGRTPKVGLWLREITRGNS